MGTLPPELKHFVQSALCQGVPRDRIEHSLVEAGWPRPDVTRALGDWVDAGLPLPVPRPRPGVSAWDAWFYLLLFTALYISAWNLGYLLFQFIEQAFPDPLDSHTIEALQSQVRWAVSWLVICAPLFLWLNLRLARRLAEQPSRRASRVRHWLTALTLFIASGSLLGDLVTLVYNLLDGDLTLRFLLKVAVVALLAGVSFLYYLQDLRRSEDLS
jgi:hypothetical protein